jgi:hypothetical protein
MDQLNILNPMKLLCSAFHIYCIFVLQMSFAGEEKFSISAAVNDKDSSLVLRITNIGFPGAVLVEWFQVGGVECDVVRKGDDPKDVRVDRLEFGRARIGPASYALLPKQGGAKSTVGGVFVVKIPIEADIDPVSLIGANVRVRIRYLEMKNLARFRSADSGVGDFLRAFESWSSNWIQLNQGYDEKNKTSEVAPSGTAK